MSLYKVRAKIGLKDFQVKAQGTSKRLLRSNKFLQVFPSEVSSVFQVKVIQNYSHALQE